MNLGDLKPGQRVVSLGVPDEVGTVTRVDHWDGVAYVRFAIPGHPGKTDEIDIDPAEFILASEWAS